MSPRAPCGRKRGTPRAADAGSLAARWTRGRRAAPPAPRVWGGPVAMAAARWLPWAPADLTPSLRTDGLGPNREPPHRG